MEYIGSMKINIASKDSTRKNKNISTTNIRDFVDAGKSPSSKNR